MDAQLALHRDASRPELLTVGFDEEELAVAGALRWGRANARKVPEIAKLTGLSVRRTQLVIRRLVETRWWPIGTSMRHPFGNYLIDDASELASTERLLRDHGISTLQRAAALRRMSLSRYIHQVQTDLLNGDLDNGA